MKCTKNGDLWRMVTSSRWQVAMDEVPKKSSLLLDLGSFSGMSGLCWESIQSHFVFLIGDTPSSEICQKPWDCKEETTFVCQVQNCFYLSAHVSCCHGHCSLCDHSLWCFQRAHETSRVVTITLEGSQWHQLELSMESTSVGHLSIDAKISLYSI